MIKESKQFSTTQNPNEGGSLSPILESRQMLDEAIAKPLKRDLGPLTLKTDVQSLTYSKEGVLEQASFRVLPEYKTQYPDTVVQALVNIYSEYNGAFGKLVHENSEFDTDYQYSKRPDGTPINRWVQIDMVGLPEQFLQSADQLGVEQVQDALRGRIFELENSLAMYQLLERVFENNGSQTQFDYRFRASLDELRQTYGKPVALLAVTELKYQAMKEEEFGKREGESLTDEDVQKLSGFDKMFGPEDFQNYLKENNGKCDYLLYVRSSIPKIALRKPGTAFENPLLADDQMRRIIRENAITFNVDNPNMPLMLPTEKADSHAWMSKINDTKAWMMQLGMAHPVFTIDDLYSQECVDYLLAQGVPQEQIDSDQVVLRGKPMLSSYGAYGHEHAPRGNKKFKDDLKTDLRKRGPYVVQPEFATPTIITPDGSSYTYIDRNFLSTNDGIHFQFMGGFRSLMPLETQEANRGRVHGNGSTVWAEIR